MKYRKFKIVRFVSVCLIIFSGIAWWWLWSVPVSEQKLKQLTPGMSQLEVVNIIGRADATNQAAGGETWLIYEHKPSIVGLIVMFDGTGHFIKYVID